MANWFFILFLFGDDINKMVGVAFSLLEKNVDVSHVKIEFNGKSYEFRKNVSRSAYRDLYPNLEI